MKIAILGATPIGIETALYFSELGANIRIFDSIRPQHHNFPIPLKLDGTWAELTSVKGREISQLSTNLNQHPTFEEYHHSYFQKIYHYIGSHFHFGEVDRVHKRFLSRKEKVANKTRLEDLFRVVINQAPVEINERNAHVYQELESKIGKDIIESLKSSVEHYEDFDLVIDCNAFRIPRPMGPSSSFAIGEKRLAHSSQIHYGYQNFYKSDILMNSENTQLAMVGTGQESALCLIKLKEWIANPNHQLKIFTEEEFAYKNLKDSSSKYETQLYLEVSKILERDEINYQKSIQAFQVKINEWKELDDFVRVKYPKPAEPARQIEIYERVNVTVVDRLIDQPRIYLSVESPHFRAPSLLAQEITTFPADHVIVCTGYEFALDLYKGIKIDPNQLIQDEAGIFIFPKLEIHQSLPMIQNIEHELMKYFKKAE